jgi:hypothetical protein
VAVSPMLKDCIIGNGAIFMPMGLLQTQRFIIRQDVILELTALIPEHPRATPD